jgi:hypothetical protein
VWFARALILFTYRRAGPGGGERAAVYVRWYEPEPEPVAPIRMVRLRYARFGAGRQPHYDVVELGRVLCPVLLQPDPTSVNTWFHNHFVAPYNL